MEELRATEILDKEIEADARRKSEKILARAEEECKKILDDVKKRIQEAEEQKSAYYSEKIHHFEKNIEAAVPLEKARFLVSFYDDSVSGAFNAYFEQIGTEKRLALVGKKILSLPPELLEKQMNVFVFGFSVDAVRKMLGTYSFRHIQNVEAVSFEKSGEEAANGNNVHEGIILESADGTVRIRLTVDQLVREIKDRYSKELAEALFCGSLPE